MSKVQCYECKRTYDYDEDGFCPRCGAFNQPPRARRIDANGNIVYQDGINEKAHAGSFVHQEYHSENRKRVATPLEQSAPRPTIHTTKRSAAKVQSGKKKGLSAAIYTQLSDVEDETNGLMTYDRKICKVDEKRMNLLSRALREE